jgi:tRNA(fMet)-specific endonuclease VapC
LPNESVRHGILAGSAAFVRRAAAIPSAERKVPVIVVEEILRGRLHAIRQAEAGKSKISIDRAYAYLAETIEAFRPVPLLAYSAEAESLFQQWRRGKIRGSAHDLRIAATCVVHGITLISRNRRHFENMPGLKVEFWT